MCGICGAFHYREGQPDAALVRRQLDVLAHRGPDDSGIWSGDGAVLGHARLSIRDLSPGGHQPIANEDETLWLVCNGEFYAIDPLRDALAARGHRFRGTGDSELALHLYEEHGDDLLARLRGMFAFALFDRARRRLLIARDRLGKKPLYWHDDGHRVAFASELKALLVDPAVPRDVDATALASYLALRYVPSPRTPWRGVHKLEPGHVLVADASGVRTWPYWQLPHARAGAPRPSDAEAIEAVRARIEEAVRLRLVADVPVGAFLSGGMDSAAVLSVMTRVVGAPVKAYTVGYEGIEDDESVAARELAAHLGVEHHTLTLGPDALRVLPELVWQADEPFADPSIVPTHFVSQRAREDVTVVLTGDGGDEVFAGYKTYPAAAKHARLGAIPAPLRALAALPAGLYATDDPKHKRFARVRLSVLERHLDAMECFAEGAIRGVLAPEFARALEPGALLAPLRARYARHLATHDAVAALPRLDAETYLPDDVLHKVDRASMLHALEVRSPLLDQELVEYAATLPFDLKLREGTTKWVLREAVAKLMPGEHARRPKQGFNPPLERWLRGPASALASEVLGDPRTRERGWIAPGALARYATPQANGGDAFRQWALLNLELWARTYVDRPREQLGRPIGW